MDVILIDDPRTYYCNITNGVVDGLGTIESPLNRMQMLTIMETSLVDGDIFNIKGLYEVPSNELHFLGDLGYSGLGTSSAPINITIQGYDIENSGSPIIRWNNPDETPDADMNTWWNIVYSYINVTFKNIIMFSRIRLTSANSNSYVTMTYKDCVVISPTYINNGILGANIIYYGCTFNNQVAIFRGYNNIKFYDSVLDFDSITISNSLTLTTFNNITTNMNFDDGVSDIVDLDEYIKPLYKSNIISLPYLSDLDSFVGYYTNPQLMYFENYGLYVNINTFMSSFRTTNDYNNGLFGEPRISYGAYSFEGELPPNDYATSGHIGSFYFGGEYTNAIISSTANITLVPTEGNVSINYSYNNIQSFITLDIPNKEYAIASQNFYIDFVAKKKSDDSYPKFCGLSGTNNKCNNCATNSDVVDYMSQVAGGNPLIVDFSACAEGAGMYSGYIPKKYKWWFDYGNYSGVNDCVTCSTPYATHTYCGGYLEEYDVKLCVEFAK
jgi:hypothetical protein